MNNREFQQRTEQIEQLVQRVQSITDESSRTTALELLQSVMDLHGAVVGRMLELLQEAGDPGQPLLEAFAADPLVSGLLVLYGVHPLDLETRVARALDKVRPYLQSQGGSVDLIELGADSVRLRLQGGSHACGSSADKLKLAVEQAIYEAAPEIAQIAVEGLAAPSASGFVPLTTLQPAHAQENRYEKSAA